MKLLLPKKPISCELGPNVRPEDIQAVLKLLFIPINWFSWKRGKSIYELENYFKKRYKIAFAKSFDNGRSALQAILESLDLQTDDCVFIQAFTCVVVPNSIIAAKASPIYVDIDQTLNMNPDDLRKKIKTSESPRAVIIQHTFGTPAQVDEIKKICQEHNLYLIEDCAHSIGSTYKGKEIGTFGDAAMFSFGRDKAISSVSGGMAITNKAEIGQGLNRIWKAVYYPSLFWIKQRMLHVLVFTFAKKLYFKLSLGKVIIHVSKLLGVVPLVLSLNEKNGVQHSMKKLPNAMAKLALLQLRDIDKLNQHRADLSRQYENELIKNQNITLLPRPNDVVINNLRFSVLIKDAHKILQIAKKRRIYLGNWYHTVIAPEGSILANVDYQIGSCPHAENITEHILNLPTNIQTTKQDAQYIIDFINNYTENNE